MKRKHALVNDNIYHLFNRSISGYKIFNNSQEFIRMKETALYYQLNSLPCKFSKFIKLSGTKKKSLNGNIDIAISEQNKIVHIIAYCFMPTHYHFILKQIEERGIERFIGNIQNSYSRYFNIKHGRKGPLWEGKYKNVLVETDEQLLHLSRYIHLNPTNSSLVECPKKWKYSSLHEYLSSGTNNRICDFSEHITIKPELYEDFVISNVDHQRELNQIKHLVIE